jgi:endonuclease
VDIRVSKPFILLANCEVYYDGRAKSSLVPGDYLIIRKGDGTLLIHGGSKFNPLNYQPSGAILRKEGNKLISTRKRETITIIIHSIMWYREPVEWSENKIEISRTEYDLKLQIIRDIKELTGDRTIKEVTPEFKTPYGPIDVVAITETNLFHIIEVKRGKSTLSSCAQLERYLNYFKEINTPTKGWLMSPDISKGAVQYAANRSIEWRKVLFEV